MRFDSIAQRFYDDMGFRHNMEEYGWSGETICLIDAIALMPALENPGRTRAERAVYEEFNIVHEEGGQVQADPTRFVHPQSYAAGERRREEHEHWATDSRRLQIEEGKLENQGKGKGFKGKFAAPLQAIRESKSRGKGKQSPTWSTACTNSPSMIQRAQWLRTWHTYRRVTFSPRELP